MPEPHIVRSVVKALNNAGLARDARILDLSCGDGWMIHALQRDGYSRVEGTHFREDDYIYQNPSPSLNTAVIHRGVDLAARLPFPDASFHAVVATEVVEHLPSHASFAFEIGRILKSGGRLVFTTPNTQRILSRLQFFLTGTHDLCGARLGWHVPASALYSTHFNPVYFPVFHTLLHDAGMTVKRLYKALIKPESVALGLGLYPVLALSTGVEMIHYIKRSRAGGLDLLRWLLHPIMLCGEQIVVDACKDSAASAGELRESDLPMAMSNESKP